MMVEHRKTTSRHGQKRDLAPPVNKLKVFLEFFVMVAISTFLITWLNFAFDMDTFDGAFLNALILGLSTPFFYVILNQLVEKIEKE